jgi:hypothetical protein
MKLDWAVGGSNLAWDTISQISWFSSALHGAASFHILCDSFFIIIQLINYVWSKEELPDQWKESIIVPIHKKGDKTDCNNYRGISLLSTSYKILSNISLSRLSPYVDEIIGDHQCGFRRNRSTTLQIFCIRQILE